MDAKNKWKLYVERLGVSENAIKRYIKDFRLFKRKVFSQKHENLCPEACTELFDTTPNFHLNRIHNERIKIQFCKLKIQYYRELELNGETIGNQNLLFDVNMKCKNLMKKHPLALTWK